MSVSRHARELIGLVVRIDSTAYVLVGARVVRTAQVDRVEIVCAKIVCAKIVRLQPTVTAIAIDIQSQATTQLSVKLLDVRAASYATRWESDSPSSSSRGIVSNRVTPTSPSPECGPDRSLR